MLNVNAIRGRVDAPACIQTRNQHELTLEGKKIGGGAQLRGASALLQHGFIMLEIDPYRTARVLCGPDHAYARSLANQLRSRATSVSAALGRPVNARELRQSITNAFEEALGPASSAPCFTISELRLALHLVGDKYGRREWTLRG